MRTPYYAGAKIGHVTILTVEYRNSERWCEFRCDCGAQMERQISRLRDYVHLANKHGVEVACRQCLKKTIGNRLKSTGRPRGHVRDFMGAPTRGKLRFDCNVCCDLAHRDCDVCGWVGVPEALERATGWERTDSVEGRRAW
jgi:hypothetical protein